MPFIAMAFDCLSWRPEKNRTPLFKRRDLQLLWTKGSLTPHQLPNLNSYTSTMNRQSQGLRRILLLPLVRWWSGAYS